MDRNNHYEAAFEAYLQQHRLCYVAVDETRRAMLGESRIKSLDFIVHGEPGARLLVDVKGRRFPSGLEGRQRRVWESWSMQEDIDGLVRWQTLFGYGWQGLLVFVYHVLPVVELPADTEDLWLWRGRRYLLRAVTVDDYRQHARVRSPRWRTVSLPSRVFRSLIQPLHAFVQGPAAVPETCPF